MSRVVKNFFRFLHVFFIIFLTGCVAREYHRAAGGIAVPAETLSFRRPLEGNIASHFGGLEDGVTLKGIVFRGAEGQEVFSAEQGEVVYVDGSLRGYGQTVVVQHGARFSTVYARNSQVLVKVGDTVRKGQAIARIGAAGKGTVPQLYFELRRDTKPLDPELMLK